MIVQLTSAAPFSRIRRRSAPAAALGLWILVGCGGEQPPIPGEEAVPPAVQAEGHASIPQLSDDWTSPDIQAVSLLGDTLRRSMLDSGSWDLQQQLLTEAKADLEASPGSADALIWAGRRLGYLGRYEDAIAVFSRGVDRHPDDARFLRHRGHRLISIRDLEGAVADLSRAWEMVQGSEDETEPDGLPNERGIPTSTLHSNIRYHLGLAHYLMGDFEGSREAYQADVDASVNPDMLVASSYWLYLSLRRLGRDAEAEGVLAATGDDLDIIENHAYYDLLKLFKGSLSEADVLGEGDDVTLNGTTVAYGVGAWHLLEGRTERAGEIFQEILEGKAQWPAFGYIAAEAELARER